MILPSSFRMKAAIAFVAVALFTQSCSKEVDFTGSTSMQSSHENVVTGAIIGNQEVIELPKDELNNQTQALLYLPKEYKQTNENYPLIISLHGMGAAGTDISVIMKASSLADNISKGFVPEAINPVDHKLYKFITVSPQAPQWSYGATNIKAMLPALIKRYRIDTTRIYVVGYSAGGYGTWTCATDDTSLIKRIAAIVPMDAAGIEKSVKVDGVVIKRYDNLRNVSTYDLPVWNICGEDDQFWSIAVDYTNKINSLNPTIPVKLTGLPGVGHSGWVQGYDPKWRVDGMNIYEWMLQYTRTRVAEKAREVKLGITNVRVQPREEG
ncbi:MAG: alpha/beta hydrolase-fold protein [Ilyomonas sp.]